MTKVLTAAVLLAALYVSGTALSNADTAVAGTEWQAHVNRTVYRAHHWAWILRRLERHKDELHVTIAFKNNGNNRRPILLDANFMKSTHLAGAEETFVLLSVKGVSAEMSQVGRRSTQESVFVFRYPEAENKVRFTSRWMTMAMMNGAATLIDVNFDLRVPPPEAKSG